MTAAVDRVPLPGGLVHATDRSRCLGPPSLSTCIVKSKQQVVAVGDLDAAETVGPMTSSEPSGMTWLCSSRP